MTASPWTHRCITVVVPVTSRHPARLGAVSTLLRSPLVREVVIVGNASPQVGDGAPLDGRIRLVNPQVASGYGAALARGAAEATAPILLLLDPDLDLSPSDIAALAEPLHSGEAAVVHGSRRSAHNWASRAAAALTTLPLTDPTITCVAIRRDDFLTLDLRADGTAARAALASEVGRHRLAATEVPISPAHERPRRGRRRSAARHLAAAMRHSPRWPRRNIGHPSAFDVADSQLATTLADLDAATGNYARWIVGLTTPHLGSRVLEIGAGHGTMTDLLASDGRHVTASDLSERCVQELRARFDGHPSIDVVHGDSHSLDPAGYDSAVLVNVLEHIDDDVAALAALRETLCPGGRVCIFTPAFEGLYSEFDRKVGHHRRYRRSTLATSLELAGFRMIDVRYVNLPGAFAWWLVARQLGITPTHSRLAWLYDRLVVPLTRRIEAHIRPPFGQSVFAVGERPTHTMQG